MQIRVLGSAAGGGFPQWNCNCLNCDGWRKGTVKALARTQSSIAVSSNGADWLLVNASPDVLQQIRNTPALQRAGALRDSGIAAVLLMDAQIDHVTGLLMLRERGAPLPLYATPEVLGDLAEGFPLTTLLSHYCGVEPRPLVLGEPPLQVPFLPGASVHVLSLSSKPPPYSPHRERPRAGDNIGLLVENTDTGRRVFYAPGLGQMEPHVWAAMQAADCVLVDGTLWTDDEMITLGASQKTSRAMGHLPQSGPGGMLEWLDQLPASTRKVLIHINNTNPILDEDSPQRQELTRRGIEVAYDGMEIEL